MLGKSIISTANKVGDQDANVEILKMEWPEDSIERAKVIRSKACSMTRCVETVSSSFITGRSLSNIYFYAFMTFILFLYSLPSNFICSSLFLHLILIDDQPMYDL